MTVACFKWRPLANPDMLASVGAALAAIHVQCMEVSMS